MRGFFFTLMAVSLLTLLAVSLVQQRTYAPVGSTAFSVFEKVDYVWSDVAGEFSPGLSLNITKTEDVLQIDDELPAPRNLIQSLDDYMRFVRRYYNSTDLSIGLFTQDGVELTDYECFGKKDCKDNEVGFEVLPFNISYVYPDWKKKFMDLTCNSKTCDFSSVEWLNISINLSGSNFTCNPAVYNNCTEDDIQWDEFDKVFDCKKKDNLCVNYTLSVTDAAGATYACPGVYGDDKGKTKKVNCDSGVFNWLDGDEAKLTFKFNPCKLTLKFGKKGRFRVEGKDALDEDCDANFSISTVLDFNTSDYYAGFATELRIRDAFFNFSAEEDVN